MDSLHWVTVVLGLYCSWHPCVVVADGRKSCQPSCLHFLFPCTIAAEQSSMR